MVKRARPGKQRIHQDPTAAAIEAAVALHRAGDLDGAAARYQDVLTKDAHQVDALHFLGLVEHQRGHSERALELMNRSLELCPKHADFHNNRGNVLKLLGRLDEAEADYQKVLEQIPDHANALNNLGTLRRERGDFEAAVELYRKVITLEPKHADAHQNLGNALGSLNRFSEAIEAHRQALRLRPRQGDAYRHLAGMFYALGRIDEAAELYRQWLLIEPSDPIATHMLAACTGDQVPERASNDFVEKCFDQFAASFDQALLRLSYRAPQLVGEALVELLGPETRDFVVLDAGCGTGLVAGVVRRFARQLVGVDLSPKMIERARARLEYDELHVAELVEFCAQSQERYDAIISADTLVYFGVLDAAFRSMAKALRPAGRLVFTVELALTAEVPSGYRLQPHGRYQHTAPYLTSALELAGFGDIRLRQVELRKEAGKWVDGLLVTAHLPCSAGTRT